MTVTVFIRYVLDPFKLDAFERYARNWLTIIPRCGGDLRDSESVANFEFAKRERFILSEERTFLRQVSPAS